MSGTEVPSWERPAPMKPRSVEIALKRMSFAIAKTEKRAETKGDNVVMFMGRSRAATRPPECAQLMSLRACVCANRRTGGPGDAALHRI